MNLKKNSALISLLLAIIVSVCLPACSCQPKLTLLAKDSVIMAFGDSVTYGTGAQPTESYPAVLEKAIGRRVVNAGYPGELTSQGLSRLPTMLNRYKLDILLLCLGINDQLLKIDQQTVANNIRKMIKLARKRNVSVVLIAVPNLSLSPSGSSVYRDIARELCVPIEEEALSAILADNSSLKADKIHPNAAGYRRMAESIAAVLRKSGAID